MKLVQSPDEFQIMGKGFAEADTDIQDEVGGRDSMRKGKVPTLGQKPFDFGYQVVIVGRNLHIPGLSLHVHQDHGCARAGDQLDHIRVEAEGADIIYQVGPGIQGGLSDIGLIGVDGYGYAAILTDCFDQGNYPVQFLGGRNWIGKRPGRFSANVNNIGTLSG
jgi:hypothetical protein